MDVFVNIKGFHNNFSNQYKISKDIQNKNGLPSVGRSNQGDKMKFGGLQKLTLLDYPNKMACTVFTVGCNFRCPFCHNNSRVSSNVDVLTEEEILAFLQKRKNVLEGICLTGGEPLLQNDVAEFLAKVKALGYLVKLDTNGAFPAKLKQLVELGLVDYVAMDIKNSPEMYPQTVGANVDMSAICQSVEFLKGGNVDYEFRTTVTGNLHNDVSIEQMGQFLAGAKVVYLQQFVDSGDLIDPTTIGCDETTLKRYQTILQKYVANVQLRGIWVGKKIWK